jgi:two-component system sensor histidine kinase KdpD
MKSGSKNINISIGKQYFFSTIILLIFILILYNIQDIIGYQTVSLILLLIIFLLPLFNFEKGPIILSAVISAFAWDYYFIPPHFTLHITRTEDAMMLFLFFIIAITNGVLTARLKLQKNLIVSKERKSNAFYNLLKDLSFGKDLNDVTGRSVQQIFNVFGAESVVYYSSSKEKLNRDPHSASNYTPDDMDWFLAEICFVNKRESGKTTETMSDANAIYFPLIGSNLTFGVIGVKINDDVDSESEEMGFLRNFVKEITVFLEKYVS